MVCNGKTKQHRQIRCSGVFRLFRCFGVFRGVPVLLVLVHAVRWDCWFLMKEKNTITEFGIKASEQGAEREPKYPSCTPAQLSLSTKAETNISTPQRNPCADVITACIQCTCKKTYFNRSPCTKKLFCAILTI